MSAAEIAVGASSYTGNANLGGFASGVIKIDTAPIEQLNQYANDYNKTVWQQKIKDQDSLLEDLSKQNQLDLNDLIPEEKKQILDKTDALKAKGIELAKQFRDGGLDRTTALLDWRSELKKTADSVDVANKRYLSKQSREKQIAEETDPKMKIWLQKQLDNAVKTTPLDQPLPSLQAFDLKKAVITKPPSMQVGVAVYGDNSNFIREDTHTLPDQKAINAQAASIELGLNSLKVDKNSSEYLSKPPQERKLIDDQQEAFEASGKLEEIAASQHLNEALKQYSVNGVIDIKMARSKNGLLANAFDTIDAYNAHMRDMQEKIKAGVYTGSDGVKQLDEKDYQPISYEDGDISAQDLLKPKILALAESTKVVPKVTQSDNKIQMERLSIESKKADADIVYKRAMAAAAGQKAKAYVDNVKQQMKLRGTKQEQDQMLDNLFTRNITQQPSLYVPSGKSGTVDFRIDANASLPMFTFDGKNPKQLIPIGATPIGVDGQPITAGTPNAKVSHYEGGHFDVQYMFGGKPLSAQSMGDLYVKFKQVQGSKWQGSYDDFLKQGVQENQFDARIIGANGATDKGLSIAAQRSISNQATGKGETPVFSSNDSPPTEDVVPTDNSSPDNLDN